MGEAGRECVGLQEREGVHHTSRQRGFVTRVTAHKGVPLLSFLSSINGAAHVLTNISLRRLSRRTPSGILRRVSVPPSLLAWCACVCVLVTMCVIYTICTLPSEYRLLLNVQLHHTLRISMWFKNVCFISFNDHDLVDIVFPFFNT